MNLKDITPQDLIEALESGKYTKTQGRLKSKDGVVPDGFCCLGVACEIADDVVLLSNQGIGYIYYNFPSGARECTGIPSRDSPQWMMENLNDREYEVMQELIFLNDSSGTFEEKVIPFLRTLI